MGKFSKGMCSFGGGLLFAGIALLIVGFLMGGRPQGLSIRWDGGLVLQRQEMSPGGGTGRAQATLTAPPVNAQDIRSLQVDVGAVQVEIRPGSEFSLDVTGDIRYTSTVENGVWLLANENNGGRINFFDIGNNEPRLTLTVPSGFLFDNVALSVAAGTLEATGLHAKQSSVSVGAGTMKLSDFTVDGECDIDVGMGTLTLNGALSGRNVLRCGMGTAKLLLDTPVDYGYRANVGMGSVKVDGQGVGGMGAEIAQNTNAPTFYDIDCGMGSVKVEFSGTATETPDVPALPATDDVVEKAA